MTTRMAAMTADVLREQSEWSPARAQVAVCCMCGAVAYEHEPAGWCGEWNHGDRPIRWWCPWCMPGGQRRL